MSDDGELPLLSDNASAALLEFFEARRTSHGLQESVPFQENWNLSQFWYTEDTAHTVCHEIETVLSDLPEAWVACISCPTIFRSFAKRESSLKCTLFEYDLRFASLGKFVFYDYNEPEAVDPALTRVFNAVIADPPYLSEECLTKTLKTAKMLLKDDPRSRLYLLTGAVMKDVAFREAALRPVQFRPQHEKKLGNEFLLFTNKEPTALLGQFEA